MTAAPTLRGVRADEIMAFWSEIAPLIEKLTARTGGRFRAVDLAKAVIARDIQLWAALDDGHVSAIATTEIINYPQRRIGRFLATSGEDIERWIGHVGAIEEWARQNGCTAMEAVARKGLERVMKPHGWTCTHVVLEKDL